ncbi:MULTISPECIES: hypothetical protein [Stenotrophomonas]|uniref:hypothetical protein n=1 Tax=Stenotrophomonas TaxID=40323 RepID=UPI000A896A1C|nr:MULTISPECIES: hypothetical protein [Stenotrophomonas]
MKVELKYYDGGVYSSTADMPEHVRSGVLMGKRGQACESILSRGKSWLVEPFCTYQPESFRAICREGGELLLGVSTFNDPVREARGTVMLPDLIMCFPSCLVMIEPGSLGGNFEDGWDSFGSLLALPESISRSWLWRTGGWKIPAELPSSPLINRGLVAHPSSSWVPVNRVLESFDRKSAGARMSMLVERLPGAVDTRFDMDGEAYQWTSMRCFLDTRPSNESGPQGDQFFVIDSCKDGVVYHIHAGNVDSIRVLEKPGEAIDFYSSHVLTGNGGQFDFMPWSRPL